MVTGNLRPCRAGIRRDRDCRVRHGAGVLPPRGQASRHRRRSRGRDPACDRDQAAFSAGHGIPCDGPAGAARRDLDSRVQRDAARLLQDAGRDEEGLHQALGRQDLVSHWRHRRDGSGRRPAHRGSQEGPRQAAGRRVCVSGQGGGQPQAGARHRGVLRLRALRQGSLRCHRISAREGLGICGRQAQRERHVACDRVEDARAGTGALRDSHQGCHR
mmetsp:Transcript_36738/g.86904  ORF Transcript_36738/g.86904 Transcript_36738/m.86904 type:complete len:216 (-) Transcript_36738:206-853(-)